MLPETTLVSVIVPTYNYAHFLWQTLACVQMQTYGNWECVVVDDGSTDNTRKVVEDFMREDARIRYVFQPNAGLSAARNTGLRESRGQFVQLLDSDDLIEPRKLESQVAFLLTHLEVDIVCSEMRFVSIEQIEGNERNYEDIIQCVFARKNVHQMFGVASAELISLTRGRKSVDIEAGQSTAPAVFSEIDVAATLVRGNTIVVNSPLTRKSVFDAVGFFDETLRSAEDWHFWVRCALQKKQFAAYHEPLTRALVRSHPASMSQNKTRMFGAIIEMRGLLEPILNDPVLLQINREMTVQNYASLSIHECLEGKFWAGIQHLWQAGWTGKNLKWILYGILLPFRHAEILAPLVSYIKSRRARTS